MAEWLKHITIKRALSAPLLIVIRGYQVLVSPFLRPACRFYPSCSSYAYEAFHRHGVMRGGALAFRRILKCHPFHPGGVDPVP